MSRLIGLVGTVFANGPRDWGLIPGQVIPKPLKMALDTSLLSTQYYKVRIKGKVEQSREWSSTPHTHTHIHAHLGVVAIEKGAFGSPSTKGDNFTLVTYMWLLVNIWFLNVFLFDKCLRKAGKVCGHS